MEFKFIIITTQPNKLKDIIAEIELKNDNFIIAKKFINDSYYKDTENEEGLYYLDNQTISDALKNNSIFYVVCQNEKISGVTIDSFYNANIVGMSISDFNNISTNLINNYKNNLVIVWLDTKYHDDSKKLNKDINEVTYLINKINEYGYKYMYLLDESPICIAEILNNYYLGSDETKLKILNEYS